MFKFKHITLLLAVLLTFQVYADIPRTASGKPDLSGIYDTGTLTPTQRPEWLGETEYLYPFVASVVNWALNVGFEWAIGSDSDPA
ncbi:MAG: hypothetical protein ABGY96_02750 [bacterium]|nr:hypothetical protein [Gammaproteobacteria bacterium]HIL99038.1 hypothetical protein [Pseudomonadales bacterium]